MTDERRAEVQEIVLDVFDGMYATEPDEDPLTVDPNEFDRDPTLTRTIEYVTAHWDGVRHDR